MKYHHRFGSYVLTATILIGMVALWILFAPTQFGGKASYVIIAGASMEPSLHSGDLVVARQSGIYEIGDVVTYSHPQVGPIIHRIIDTSGDRYILQGDNNDWIDSFQPTDEVILGKSWLTLPGAAKAIKHLRTPLGLTLLSISVGIMVLVTITRDRTKEQNESNRTKGNKSLPTTNTFSEVREGWILPLLAILFGGVLLGFFAFSNPLLDTVSIEIPYQHRGEFSYYADASPSVYDQGMIETGDAIFHSIVREFDVRFEYEFSAPTLKQITGDYQVILELSEPNGWRRRVELIPATTFTKNEFAISTTVNITRIQWLIGHLQNRTNFNLSAYDVRIIPLINLHADIAGQEVEDRFTPSLHFKLNEHQLFLNGTTPFDESKEPLNPVEINVVERQQQIPATLSILGLDIQVENARWIAGVAVAIAFIGISYILLPIVQSWRQGESSRIALQYSEILLDVEKLPKTKPTQTINVSSFSDLAKLAQLLRLMVLHHHKGFIHTYLLQANEAAYQYSLREESIEEG